MIKEFPSDYELIAFFESEPVVLDPGVPWLYNTLEFTTIRSAIEVHCLISLSNGQLSGHLSLAGREIAKFELNNAETIRLVVDEYREVLIATFLSDGDLSSFALQLKPFAHVSWCAPGR